MPRTAEDNQRIKDERREDILTASRTVFARKGLSATKMSDIASAAGLSYGLVYHYFDSKEEIFAEIVRHAVQDTLNFASSVDVSDASPLEKLRAFCEFKIQKSVHRPEMHLIITQAFATDALPPEALAAIRQYGSKISETVRSWIQQGQETGHIIEGDPVELDMALFCALQGLAMLQMCSRVVPRGMPSVDTFLRMLSVRGDLS
ncbi:MAG: TetR/AcrR family transcriptional regulator [Sandaracinaceae bacterium]|jgi:AcrR family transcriptional regulator|nr:TetR/AcrR family transcriptional regulator [Sandaracinaceae bacterium]